MVRNAFSDAINECLETHSIDACEKLLLFSYTILKILQKSKDLQVSLSFLITSSVGSS